MPQLAVACAKVTIDVLSIDDGDVPAAAAKALKLIVSPLPTPAPATLADITTVVPVTDETVVPDGMTPDAVVSVIVMPAVIHDGTLAKCSVLLPDAVPLFVAALPAIWTRA